MLFQSSISGKGVEEALSKESWLVPVTNVKVTLIDGSYHSVDSSNLLKLAGSMAFKKAMEQANPVLLEPIMEVEVRVPRKV